MEDRNMADKDCQVQNYLRLQFGNDPNYTEILNRLPSLGRPLVSATNGFGLRAFENEAEIQKKREENEAYSMCAKRIKTEQEVAEYERTLTSIKLEAEEQVCC